MKHHLSAFRRSHWLSIFCLVILAFMCAPVAVMAAPGTVGLPLANAGGWNPMLMGSIGLGVIAYGLRSKAGEEGEDNGGGEPLDPKAALAKVEDNSLTMGQRLKIAASALRGIDPTGQLGAVNQKLTDVQATLSAKETELAQVQATLAGVQKELSARQADIAGLEASVVKLEAEKKDLLAKEQNLENRAEAKAKEKVASLGFDGSKLPGSQQASDKEVPQTRAELEAAMEKATNMKERQELLKAYREREAA